MRIKIPNYFGSLEENSTELFLVDEKQFLYNKVFANLNRNELNELANKLKISERMMYQYTSGKRKCSLKNALIIAKMRGIPNFDKELYENISAFSTWGHSHSKLPKEYSLELAYLVGFIAGDGHISKRSEIRMWNDSNKIINEIIPKFTSAVFCLTPKTTKIGNYYAALIDSKPIHLFLNKVIGLPSGKKKGKLRIPEFVFKSKDFKINFLKGLFDSDGGVTFDKYGKTSILYSASTEGFLLQVKELLTEFSINLGGPYKSGNKVGLEIRSYSKDEIKKFLNIIGSYHPKKLARMSAAVAQR